MLKAKGLVLMLILLTAMGQAVASSMLFCQMDMSDSDHQMSDMTDHTGMDMSSMQHEPGAMSDMDMSEGCGDCSCTQGCSSVAIPDLMMGQNKRLSTNLKTSLYSAQVLSQMPSSLYRPPIFS